MYIFVYQSFDNIYALIHIVHEHVIYQSPINTDRFDLNIPKF